MQLRRLVRNLPALALGLSLAACCSLCRPPEEPPSMIDLEPDDPRPVYSVEVADADEAALLEQQLGVEPVRQIGTMLYFFDAEGLGEQLRDFGYQPERANSYQVFRRVVRVDRLGYEEQLLAAGVRLINREEEYWVIDGALANLRSLERAGYRLRPLGRDEPLPREVRIRLEEAGQLQQVVAIHVDVFNVEESDAGIFVYGGAFDHQIDQLREAGFEVERISTVGEKGDDR